MCDKKSGWYLFWWRCNLRFSKKFNKIVFSVKWRLQRHQKRYRPESLSHITSIYELTSTKNPIWLKFFPWSYDQTKTRTKKKNFLIFLRIFQIFWFLLVFSFVHNSMKNNSIKLILWWMLGQILKLRVTRKLGRYLVSWLYNDHFTGKQNFGNFSEKRRLHRHQKRYRPDFFSHETSVSDLTTTKKSGRLKGFS